MMMMPNMKLEEAFIYATLNVMQSEYPVVAARIAWYTFVAYGRLRLYQLAFGLNDAINHIIYNVKKELKNAQVAAYIPAIERSLFPSTISGPISLQFSPPQCLAGSYVASSSHNHATNLMDPLSQQVVYIFNPGERRRLSYRQSLTAVSYCDLSNQLTGRPHTVELLILANNPALVRPETAVVTFKDAENTITGEDVSAYCRQFGEVADGNVQIRDHPRGMGKYSFVTFSNAASVIAILPRIPHIIRGLAVTVRQCLTQQNARNPALQHPLHYGYRNLIYLPEGGVGVWPGGDNIVRTYDEFHDEMTFYICELAERRRAEELKMRQSPGSGLAFKPTPSSSYGDGELYRDFQMLHCSRKQHYHSMQSHKDT